MGRKVKSLYPQKKQYKGSYSTQKRNQKKLKAGSVCLVIGLILLFGVAVCLLPATFPRLAGHEIYNVENDSMAPEIPVGSAAYISAKAPTEIKIGNIIAYMDNETILLHRVVENDINVRELTVKGAEGEDLYKVPYDSVIGVVSSHFDHLGSFLKTCLGMPGRVILICVAAAGAALIYLSSRLSKKKM